MHRKQYRVKFHWHKNAGHYYTEWFETYGEACQFAEEAEVQGLWVHAIEDEEGEDVRL